MRLARTSGLTLLCAAWLCAAPASAHQPLILTSAHTNASVSPIIADGTISYAVTAKLTQNSLNRTFRFFLNQGENLDVQYLILDEKPENQLSISNLPSVSIVSPEGKAMTLKVNERTSFFEPFSKKKYLYLSRINQIGQGGIYTVTIKGKRASSVVIAVGSQEIRGEVLSIGKKRGECPVTDLNRKEISRSLAEQLLGMSERAATACASALSWTSRVVARNGEDYAVTMDYSNVRINFKINNDKVSEVSVG